MADSCGLLFVDPSRARKLIIPLRCATRGIYCPERPVRNPGRPKVRDGNTPG